MASERSQVDELIKSVTSTTNLLENVLSEIRDHSTSLAVLKDKLASISENVDSLSHLVVEGNGYPSLVTRFAILEKEVSNINNRLVEVKKEILWELEQYKSETKKIADIEKSTSMGKWTILAIMSPGIVSLIMGIIEYILR